MERKEKDHTYTVMPCADFRNECYESNGSRGHSVSSAWSRNCKNHSDTLLKLKSYIYTTRKMMQQHIFFGTDKKSILCTWLLKVCAPVQGNKATNYYFSSRKRNHSFSVSLLCEANVIWGYFFHDNRSPFFTVAVGIIEISENITL